MADTPKYEVTPNNGTSQPCNAWLSGDPRGCGDSWCVSEGSCAVAHGIKFAPGPSQRGESRDRTYYPQAKNVTVTKRASDKNASTALENLVGAARADMTVRINREFLTRAIREYDER